MISIIDLQLQQNCGCAQVRKIIITIQNMEKDGKIPVKYSASVVFVGFLMSCSLTTFQTLPSSYFSGLPSSYWLITLSVILLTYILGFAQYFFSRGCSFLLQICEYILLPIAVICLIQRTTYYRSKSSQEVTEQKIQDFLNVTILIALTMVKILYINQVFPGESEKQILEFDRKARIFRIIKLGVNCSLLLFLEEGNLVIVRILLNCVDFFIILKSITYVDFEIEEVLLLASFNNILSIFMHHLTSFNDSILTSALSEIVLCSVFLFVSNPLKFLVEFRCMHLFHNLEITRNHFKKKDSKGLIIMFLSCFSSIYELQGSDKLVLNHDATLRWSQQFIQNLTNIYRILLNFYFEEVSQNNVKSRRNTMVQRLQSQLSQNLKQKYSYIYGKYLTELEILHDKKLFFTFVGFCMDQIDGKEVKTQPCSYSNEVFLSLVSKLNFNFLMKKSLYFYQHLARNEESMLNKMRNQKTGNYLSYYKKYYQIKISPLEHYMNFQRQLEELKQQLCEICAKETKIIQNFGDAESSFKYLENLQTRQIFKKKIASSIQKCFSYSEYLHFEEFTYLYLLFKVIFCKSIYTTSKEIYQKFIIPKKDTNFPKNHVSKIPIVVTCGLESKNKNFGEIIMTNTIFRKKFGVCTKETLRQIKISDLIVGNSQKNKHLQLMLQSSRFSSIIKANSDHSQYHCFLKVNLQHNNFHVFKEFRVTTSIAHSFEESLFFICKIEQRNNKNFIFSSESVKLSQNLKLKNRQQIHQIQLKSQMSLIEVDARQLQTLFTVRQDDEFGFEDSMHIHYSTKEEKLSQGEKIQKFTKIQNKIWERSWLDNLVLVKLSCLAITMCCLTIFLSAFSFYWCKNFTAHSKNTQNQILDYVSNIQASPLHLSLGLTLKTKIDSNDLAVDSCGTYIPNLLDFVNDNSNYWVDQKFNEYFSTYPLYKEKIIPILDINFWSSLQVSPQDDVLDVQNYLSILETFANEYISTNLSTITANERQQLIQLIQIQNRIDESSIRSRLLNRIMEIALEHSTFHQTEVNMIYMGAVILMSVAIVLMFVFLFRAFWEYLQYFELQSKIGEEYLNRRSDEIKFITKQIEQMKNYFTECEFISHFQVSFQALHGRDKKIEQQIVTLDEFQKVVDYESSSLVSQPSKYESQELYLTILTHKKCSLLLILFSLVVLVVATILNGRAHDEIGANRINFLTLLKQGEHTRENMEAVLYANWIKYFQYSQIREQSKNKQIFEESTEFLDKKSFITALVNKTDQSILKETSYLNLCDLLHRSNKNLTTFETCQKQINEISELEISPLITIMLQNEDAAWGGSDKQITLNSLCKQTKTYFQYFQPAILAIWEILYEKMDQSIETNIKLYLLVICCGASVAFLCILRQVYLTYYSLAQVLKFEIFTMDTAQDLYSKADFRSYLNRMYYRELH